MRQLAFGLVALATLMIACGSDDEKSSPDAGSGGGSGGSATGGTSGAGGAAGSGGMLCSAATKPYEPSIINCQTACANFTAYCAQGSGCQNPYCNDPQCPLACDTIKGGLTYSNALFGCAAENPTCAGFSQCLKDKCG